MFNLWIFVTEYDLQQVNVNLLACLTLYDLDKVNIDLYLPFCHNLPCLFKVTINLCLPFVTFHHPLPRCTYTYDCLLALVYPLAQVNINPFLLQRALLREPLPQVVTNLDPGQF